MTLDRISPRLEDFLQTNWQSVIDESGEKRCDVYQKLFYDGAIVAEASDDANAQEVFELLFHICTLRLSLDTPNTPYISWGPFQIYRSADVGDFTTDQLDTLQAVLPGIADAELKARIADILWVRRHGDYQNAETAVRAYLQSARNLENHENWVHCAQRIERALQLARQLGQNTSVFPETVEHIETVLDRYQGEDPLFLSAHLMELLLDIGQGDPNKCIALSEKAARLAELASDAMKWRRARTYWELNAKWHSRNNDEESRLAALIKAAETYVKRAEDTLDGTSRSYSIAGSHLRDAIEAYRRIGGMEDRREELHKLLRCYQKKAVRDLRPSLVPLDISQFVEKAVTLVKGKSLHSALVALALSPELPSARSLRKRVKSHMRRSGLKFAIPMHMLDKDGKIKGKRPGTAGISDDEAVIRPEMFLEAQREHEWLVGTTIRPAIVQINAEHYFRETDLLPILIDNPFVPPGREMLYARGLYAGLTGDMLVASHILLPQLENSFRYVLEQQEHILSGLDDDQIQDDYTLNKIFYDYESELQEILGEDLLFDLQGLLIERFGSNLRNLVAHGLLDGYELLPRQMLYLWWVTLRLCCRPIYPRFIEVEVSEDSVRPETSGDSVSDPNRGAE